MKVAVVQLDCQPQPALPTLIPPATEAPGVTDLTGGTQAAASLVGVAGMAAWDALASDQKARVNTTGHSCKNAYTNTVYG